MGFLHDLYGPSGKIALEQERGLTIIRDKSAYVSPLDRTVVEGRTAHRDHMARHGVVEAGDMKIGERARPQQSSDIRSDIRRAIERHNR